MTVCLYTGVCKCSASSTNTSTRIISSAKIGLGLAQPWPTSTPRLQCTSIYKSFFSLSVHKSALISLDEDLTESFRSYKSSYIPQGVSVFCCTNFNVPNISFYKLTPIIIPPFLYSFRDFNFAICTRYSDETSRSKDVESGSVCS